MRIALISDIHYGTLATTSELAIEGEPLQLGDIQNAKPLFQGLIDVLKTEHPDYLFIAGDLTTSGSPLEFKYCYHKIFKLGEEVGIKADNMIFCLGNHDIDWRISKLVNSYVDKSGTNYLSDDIDFLKKNYNELAACSWPIIKSALPSNTIPSYSDKHTTPFTGVIEYPDCIAFVLNSSHLCIHDQKYKHGSLSNPQLDWFKKTAQQHCQSTKAKIVLLHHHPFNYPYPLPGLDISSLEEGSELLQICGESGIDLVLHGHRHHPKAKTIHETGWKKSVTYICSGSLSVNASHRLQGSIPNMFHIIDYKNPYQIILSNYSYKPAEGWLLISNNCPETPIDGKMQLGKVVEEDIAIKLVKDLPDNQSISYDSLCEELKYIPHNQLNKIIKDVHGEKKVIHGEFPKEIMIYDWRNASCQ